MYKFETRRILLAALLLSLAAIACNLPGSGGVEPEEGPTEAPTVPAATPEPVEQEAGGVPTAEPTAPEVVEEEAPPPGGDPAFGFKQALLLALTPPRDYNSLSSYMGDHFEIIHWYGGFDAFAPADMGNILADSYLPPGQTLTFEENVDYNALIGDSPYLLYPFAADFWYTKGWGTDGMDEALILIAQHPDGMYYWYGLLYAAGGFGQPEAAPSGAWQPLPADICDDLHQTVSDQVGTIEVTLYYAAPFTDYVSGTDGEGCRIVVEGTDADGIDFWAVYDQLGQTLATMGWTRDIMYDADGPTGSMSGYRRDSGLILLHVGWKPSEDANCPQDQPIGACDLAPEQRLWTLELQGAMQ
jgi:hypothetical protein